MEGYKNPSPLSWAWFGAVRIERKPLRYEQDFRRLLHHTHPRRRPLSYFLSPVPDKEDEHDEDEDRTEAEAAVGERASQPSTPQTPADKGMSVFTLFYFYLSLRGEKLNYNSCASLLLRKSQTLLFLAPEVQWASKFTVFVRFTFPLNVSNHAHIWYVTWPQ